MENMIARIPGASHGRSATSPVMPVPPGRVVEAPSAPGRAPYLQHGSSVSSSYRDMPLQFSPGRGEPPHPSSNPMPHVAAPQSPYSSPTYHEFSNRPTHSIPSSSTHGRALSTSPVLSSSSRLAETRAPASRRASLSLAAITTPYTPEGATYTNQPKNRQAQTLPSLGQRLRQVSAYIGPAAGIPRRARKGTHITARRRILVSRRWHNYPHELWQVHRPPTTAALRHKAIYHLPHHPHPLLSSRGPSVIGYLHRCLGNLIATS